MGETGETRETGEDFDLFRRRMPAFNGTELKLSNNPPMSELVVVDTRCFHGIHPRRSNNKILTGLTGLTGLADPSRLAYGVANECQETLVLDSR
jgi:hypothetical protein